jgi:uncharacterized protein with FMN-binding domain
VRREPRRIGAFLGLATAVVGVPVLVGTFGSKHVIVLQKPADEPVVVVVPRRTALAVVPVTRPPVVATRLPAATARPTAAPRVVPSLQAAAPTAVPVATRSAAPAQRTIVGDTAVNQYGAVQVELLITGTHIDEVRVLQAPQSTARDRSINAGALPQLRQQVLSAQSADIDGVSGATYTSQSYALSVQSALDKA